MSIFDPLLSPYLRSLLYPPSPSPQINLHTLLPPSLTPARLTTTALPHLSIIELVTAASFATHYDPLYKSMFPIRTERESSSLITARLEAQFAGTRSGLAPYHIVGLRDRNGQVIGAAQFSVLLLPGDQYAVPYLQYIYVRAANRRQDMAAVLHTLVLGVAEADAIAADRENGIEGRRRKVPFTLFETEPPGHGVDEASRAYARQRAEIHARAGGVALVLRREGAGKVLSAHVQPGLEVGDGPLTLVWVIRPNPAMGDLEREKEYGVSEIGGLLVKGYYQSLRDEGFPDANIRVAEEIVARREEGSVYALMPLVDVLPFTDAETGGVV